MEKNYILDKETANRKLIRMAYEIVENNVDEPSLILAGIEENGAVMARWLQNKLAEICTIPTTLLTIVLDKRHPGVITLSHNLSFNDKTIIVIDDVANSGKTMLYAMKPFLEQYPKKIQTLALVERTHKAFPVNTDYKGISLGTTMQEHIFVEVEGDVVTGAYLV